VSRTGRRQLLKFAVRIEILNDEGGKVCINWEKLLFRLIDGPK
jgi:hypothetical protein